MVTPYGEYLPGGQELADAKGACGKGGATGVCGGEGQSGTARAWAPLERLEEHSLGVRDPLRMKMSACNRALVKPVGCLHARPRECRPVTCVGAMASLRGVVARGAH